MIKQKGMLITAIMVFLLSACATTTRTAQNTMNDRDSDDSSSRYSDYAPPDYASRLPSRIHTNERTILIDPSVHAWGAYNSDGYLVRAGLATAGSSWCEDIGRPCRTKIGHFRIFSLGSSECKSSRYPIPDGGAPMPYCMFFNGHQGLHGSYQVVEGNVSHGCVRVEVDDAEWIRFNFARVGTKVIVQPY